MKVISDPAAWWRTLCWLGDHRIALSGDLPRNHVQALKQLDYWVDSGVTHIIDVRSEHEVGNDRGLVKRHAPHIQYHWVPADDDGRHRDDAWFDKGLEHALEALLEPDSRIVIHCHMGVNRAPSMALAVLLGLGEHHLDALDLIRESRPIAAALYSDDAVSWFLRRHLSLDPFGVEVALLEVDAWHEDNPLDVVRVIRSIDRLSTSLY